MGEGGNIMSNAEKFHLPVEIHIISEVLEPHENDWQQECHQFYRQIRRAPEIDKVEPHKKEIEEEGHRGGAIEIFNMITTGISSVGGLTAIVSVASLWLEHRKQSKVVLKFPDGMEITLPNASESEINRILKLYQDKIAQQ